MKKHFPGFFPKDKNYYHTLWETCVFIFDSNVLLDFYRYSSKACDEIYNFLDTYSKQKRLWLPHQVAFEFFNNREGVISQQSKSYANLKNIINEFQNKIETGLSNYKKHKTINKDKLYTLINEKIQEIQSYIDERNNKHPDYTKCDEVLEKLFTLFENNVGDEYENKRKKEIFQEGQERFTSKTPPGYKDNDKQGHNKYGDLIIWNQILDFSKTHETDVIFVTNDVKEDWFTKENGKTAGPRPELLNEFALSTNRTLHIYTLDGLLHYYKKTNNTSISQDTIKEVTQPKETAREILTKTLTGKYLDIFQKLNFQKHNAHTNTDIQDFLDSYIKDNPEKGLMSSICDSGTISINKTSFLDKFINSFSDDEKNTIIERYLLSKL